MSEETLSTAAMRVVRFIRVDNERHGGLLSIDTAQAAEMLAAQVALEERRARRALRVIDGDAGGQ